MSSAFQQRPAHCTVCVEQQPAKYTCPRCTIRTCSLDCSRAHKAQYGCSGVRERNAYVPMNKYGYTELMNDYVFLEDVGRQVDHWGRHIVRGGYAPAFGTSRPAETALRGTSMRAQAKGRPNMRARRQEKRSLLAVQLSLRDVYMDFLPAGMESAQRNRSYWDPKKRRAFFTIEFSFHPSPDSATQQEAKSVSFTTHRNDWETPIWQLVHSSIKAASKYKRDAIVDWLGLDEVDTGITPSGAFCLMKRPKLPDDPPHMKFDRPRYYKLDWSLALSAALRGKHFIEFPSILILDESSFDGILVSEEGVEEDLRERPSKFRKLDPAVAKKTLSGLIGAYGSDNEDESARASKVLHVLDDYSGSDISSDEESARDAEERDDAVETRETQYESGGEEEVTDIRGMLNRAGVEAENHDRVEVIHNDNDNDVAEWGDDEIAEDEVKIANLTATLERRYSRRYHEG